MNSDKQYWVLVTLSPLTLEQSQTIPSTRFGTTNITFFRPPRNLDSKTTITIDGKLFEVDAADLECISPLGHGAYGVVEKMRHRQTNTVMAVKRITCTVNSREQQRLLMDLDVSMRSSSCPYTVQFFGALFREVIAFPVIEVLIAKICESLRNWKVDLWRVFL